MVNGGVVARALYFMSSQLGERADAVTYTANTNAAIKAQQSWYNGAEGLWDTTGWWNAGNVLTTLADFARLDPTDANVLGLAGVFANTFTNAQKTTQTAVKTIDSSGMVSSNYARLSARDLSANGFGGFINNFLDDEGWWALGWIRAYDVTKDVGYLNMAETIFADMQANTNGTCGGGIWWSKERKYKNAIANELYLSVAASLANRAPNKAKYLGIAKAQWAWFKGSGMINSDNLINDGLDIHPDGSCTNNKAPTWSYNQGVILGGLVELSAAAGGDASYLAQAATIASAAIKRLGPAGILHETDGCDAAAANGCGADGAQFKGVFMRNLGYLQRAAPQDAFRVFIEANADSLWSSARDPASNRLGLRWDGPVGFAGGPTAATHSSALDVLVAAMAVVGR